MTSKPSASSFSTQAAEQTAFGPDEDLLIRAVQELLAAECDYRSAMSIYRDHPNHRARIRAESNWYHSKNIVKAMLRNIRAGRPANGVCVLKNEATDTTEEPRSGG